MPCFHGYHPHVESYEMIFNKTLSSETFLSVAEVEKGTTLHAISQEGCRRAVAAGLHLQVVRLLVIPSHQFVTVLSK